MNYLIFKSKSKLNVHPNVHMNSYVMCLITFESMEHYGEIITGEHDYVT